MLTALTLHVLTLSSLFSWLRAALTMPGTYATSRRVLLRLRLQAIAVCLAREAVWLLSMFDVISPHREFLARTMLDLCASICLSSSVRSSRLVAVRFFAYLWAAAV